MFVHVQYIDNPHKSKKKEIKRRRTIFTVEAALCTSTVAIGKGRSYVRVYGRWNRNSNINIVPTVNERIRLRHLPVFTDK